MGLGLKSWLAQVFQAMVRATESPPEKSRRCALLFPTHFSTFLMPRKSFPELINSPGMPVLVDFYATWCGPCKTMAPILEQVAAQHGGKLRVIKIDVDRNAAVAQQYRVQSIPTLILFHQGQPVWRQAGVVPATQIEQALRAYISS